MRNKRRKKGLAAAARLGDEQFREVSGRFEAGDEAADAWEGEAVEDLQAAFVVGDDAGFAEDGEVAGDGGPAEADPFDELANAALLVGEGLDDRDASGMPERLEDFVGGNGGAAGFHGRNCFVF